LSPSWGHIAAARRSAQIDLQPDSSSHDTDLAEKIRSKFINVTFADAPVQMPRLPDLGRRRRSEVSESGKLLRLPRRSFAYGHNRKNSPGFAIIYIHKRKWLAF
jgi:hypothetical protein